MIVSDSVIHTTTQNFEVLRGKVIPGANRGKILGFPTANLDITEEILPPSGIYAVWVRIELEDMWRPGAANIGVNPTFGEEKKKIEVYLLEYTDRLYEKTLEVVPVVYIRPEKKFKTPAKLIRRMKRDCRKVKNLLSSRKFRAPDKQIEDKK
jgi:riboflavin kinase/FMN adenylyltransferase